MATLANPPRSETPVSPAIPEFPVSSVQLQRLSNRSDGSGMLNNASPQRYSTPPQAMAPESPSPSLSNISSTSAFNHHPATPTNVHPPPAYVAAFGAAQVVNESKRHFSDDEADSDEDAGVAKSPREDMQFSEASLALVNGFLDQLLYSILLVAKSTTLTALRPAVTEVLRSRLAAEAIASAEEELSELLAGGDEEEEEMNQKQSVQERKRRWDTELVWKRTRLRVMVYIRLGEMEDDDEERYVREDELFAGGERRFSHSSGLVSWAAAIFLTSVLEYVAEQVLQAAGSAADGRSRRISRTPRVSAPAGMDGVTVVEEYDMEKVALNSTLGRLWRTWRKSLRGAVPPPQSPTPTNQSVVSNNFSHRLSRDHPNGVAMNGSPRWSSFGNAESVSAVDDSRPASTTAELDKDTSDGAHVEDIPEAQEYPEHVLAANIPLPMANEEYDIEEIEFPEHVLAANIPLPMANEEYDIEQIEFLEHIYAANIALPMSDMKRDVDEIEVPGLARDPDEQERDGDRTPTEAVSKRRSSWSAPTLVTLAIGQARKLATAEDSAEAQPESKYGELKRSGSDASAATVRPSVARQRSASVPSQFPLPVLVPTAKKQKTADEDVPAEKNEDDKPEPKANAAEMAPHKRMASLDKSIPDKDDRDQPDGPTAASAQQIERRSVPGTVVATAVAGVATAATAAGVAAASLLGVGDNDEKSVKSGQTDTPDMLQPQQEEVEPNDSRESLSSAQRLSLPATGGRRSWNSEELKSAHAAKRISLGQAVLVRAASQKISHDSFTFHEDGDQTSPPASQEVRHVPSDLSREYINDEDGEGSEIGVARTSDTPVRTSDTLVLVASEEPEVQVHARENERDSFNTPAPRRPARLVLDGTDSESPPAQGQISTPQQEQNVKSPEQQFLERRSLAARPAPLKNPNSRELQPPEDDGRPSPRPSPIRSSIPNSIATSNSGVSPIVDKSPSPWRQSFPSAVKDSIPWKSSSQKTASTSDPSLPVQEHPAISKMASSSRENKSTEPEAASALTSASIRGPEDFEMFVQGGDTVKYTLTPESVRGEPSPVVEATPYLKQSRTADKPKQSPLPTPVEDTRAGRSQTSRQTSTATDEDFTSATSKKERPRSISRPPVRNTSVHRKSGLMAREPQVVTESTRDFADFIRSTGPQKEPEVRPLVSHRSTASLASLRDAHINGSRSQSPGAPKRSMSRGAKDFKDIPPLPPTLLRSGMQPRDASTMSDDEDGTSALIDFIRTGPNGAHTESDEKRQHRISRSIAPFRSTQDSDQMRDWGDRVMAQPDHKINANAQAQGAPSVRSASSVQNSYRTSANSRTGLLHQSTNSAGTDVHPAHTGQPTQLTSTSSRKTAPGQPKEPTVQKTRVRNKDPYAIDFLLDDEDHDLLTALPKNQRPVEESLMDFLRNSEPPQSSEPAKPAAAPRRGSAQGLKTLGADAVSMGRRGSAANRDIPQPKTPASPLPRTGSAAIAVGPITKPRPKLEARDNTDFGPQTGTGDLADFLRTSGPVKQPSADTVPRMAHRTNSKGSMSQSLSQSTKSMTSSQKRSRFSLFSGGISSFFGSSGRRSRKAYLDM